jgi:hypothetical protein
VPTMIEITRLTRSHRYPAKATSHRRDSNDEPLQSEMRDHLDEQFETVLVDRVEVLEVPQSMVRAMWLKGRRDAHNAEVAECALFATCNSLKSLKGRKLKSPFSNIHAVPSKLCTDWRLTTVENRLASNLRLALNSL